MKANGNKHLTWYISLENFFVICACPLNNVSLYYLLMKDSHTDHFKNPFLHTNLYSIKFPDFHMCMCLLPASLLHKGVTLKIVILHELTMHTECSGFERPCKSSLLVY